LAARRGDVGRRPAAGAKDDLAKGQEPTGRSLAIAGGCLSAAVIATGLVTAKLLNFRSGIANAGVAAGTLLVVAAIAASAFGFYRQAEHDRHAWQEYERAVKNRRWTPPPQFREPPSRESAPAPASSSPGRER